MNPLTQRIAGLPPEKRKLLERLLAKEGIDTTQALILPRPAGTDVCPMSFAQQRLWILHQLDPAGALYNTAFSLRFRGTARGDLLERCYQEILRRHEVLRTSFTARDGQPVQVIAPHTQAFPASREIDLTALPPAEREARLEELTREEARRPFDLSRPPLLRVTRLRLAEDDYVGLITLHHIVTDGWSHRVLLQELVALYEAFAAGQPSPLPPLPVQYADFTLWQRQRLQTKRLDDLLAYWRKRLVGLTPLELPTDAPRRAGGAPRGASLPVVVHPALTDALRAVGQREGATLFMTVLAAFQALLHRYSGQDDIAVGSPLANRPRKEVEGLIGFFVNTLVLRGDLSGDPSFREFLRRVRETALRAYDHQELPFEKLVEELKPERDPSRNPLFQVMFALDREAIASLRRPDLTLEVRESDSGAARFDLLLYLEEGPRGLCGKLDVNAELFTPETAARMLKHFGVLLEGIAADPGRRLSELPLLDEPERRVLLEQFAGPGLSFPAAERIHELFERQVRRNPDAIALTCDGRHQSYAELNANANRLAHHLRALGVGPDVPVGLCAERSADMVVAILAILKAGGAYVPLDPTYPAERLAWMLQDSRPPVVLAGAELAGRLPPHAAHVVALDGTAAWRDGPAADLAAPGSSADPAYVIYTSGSTGRPKGVVVTHANVVRLFTATEAWFHFGPQDVWTLFHSFAFDFSVWELWGPLLYGGRLVVVPYWVSRAPEDFYRLLCRENVTVLNQTPSAFRQLIRAEEAVGQDRDLALRCVIFGGEALDFAGLRPWVQRHGDGRPRLVNMYGITETTVHVTYHEVTREQVEAGAGSVIGVPIPDLKVYVLDAAGRPAPLGVPGEICVGGAGLARGYLNSPELTARKFVPDPFGGATGRLYRSGDVGRWLPCGALEYLGRADDQVKVRGFRIELAEVQAALAAHPGVADCAVVALSDPAGGKRLAAYLVAAGAEAPTAADLREFLRGKLPEYMVPTAFVALTALPLTANGKLDRKALPAPAALAAADYLAPRGPLEECLADVWAQVLGAERVGIRDNFFDLGGHSLLATQVVSSVRAALGVEIPLRAVFEYPTVEGLAGVVEGLVASGAAPTGPPVEPLPRQAGEPNTFAASFAQQRLWFLDRLYPDSPLYNMPAAVRLVGRLDTTALRRALQAVIHRHEALRTTFALDPSGPVQVVAPALELPLAEADLSELPPAQRDAELARRIGEEARRPFDLTAGPLLRVTFLRLDVDEHAALVTFHHIIGDAWSAGVFLRDLAALYDAFSAGRPSPLPPLAIQYGDFAAWQRGQLQGPALQEQLGYWKTQLAGIRPLDLPTDRPRPATPSPAGTGVPVELPADLADRLRDLARREGATLFMTLLAAFQALLRRYAGQDDVAVGSPVAGRGRREVEGLIGFFVNTLVLRGDLSGEPTFRQLLRRTKATALGAYAHQDVPFEKLVEELRPDRDSSRSPLFQVMFALQDDPLPRGEVGGLHLTPLEADAQTVKFDLVLTLGPQADRLAGSLRYRTELFDRATVARFVSHFQALLEAAVAQPDRRLSELSLLGEGEAQRVLAEWNATHAELPAEQAVHTYLSRQVADHPGAVALSAGEVRLTYGDLEDWSTRLAAGLRAAGVRRGDVVGVWAEHSAETVAALLGVLKAGGAFLPIDPACPAQRLAWLLDDARPRLVLAPPAVRGLLPSGDTRVAWLDELSAGGAEPPAEVGSHDAAYVIYTSGSTGRPKGVVVEHRGLLNLVLAQRKAFDVRPSDRVLQFAPLVFDASVSEVFVTLAAGATLVLAPAEQMRPGRELVELLQREAVSLVTLPPSVLAVLPAAALPGLRTVVSAGEALAADLAARWSAGRRLLDAYGPTENTVCASVGECRPGERVSIGKPIDNVRVYILDGRMRPCPVGVPGELFLGGAGVARGYLGRPGLTAERFVPDPFGPDAGGRLYRSGDLGRWLTEGELEFLGRSDEQVKVRGQRVEPAEVEAALREHPGVASAVVVARDDTGSGKRLVAYVVPPHGTPAPGPDELREFVRARLPEALTPSAYVVLEDLPRTPSGKLDRRALPPPGRDGAGRHYVAPRTGLERYLAELWQRELGLDRVGVEDDFFELGGDSIRAAVLINKVQEEFGEYVYTVALFDAPTVANLARYLGRNNSDAVRRLFGLGSLPEDVAADAALDRTAVEEFRGLVRITPARPGPRVPQNPPAVFVLSPPRSGSTLLRVLLGGSPALFAPPEILLLHFETLRQWLDALDSDRHRFWLDGTVRAVMQALGCGADEARARIRALASEGRTVKDFYGQLQTWLAGKVLVDKTPWYALDPQALRHAEDCFQGAKFIHLLRHPAATVASFEEAKLQAVLPPVLGPGAGAYSPRRLAELIWLVSQENIQAFLSTIPAQRQHRVRFEDLVQRPSEEMEKLAVFLKIAFVPTMLQPYGDAWGRMTDAVDPAGRMLGDVKFHLHQGIDPAAADGWRKRLNVADLSAPTRELAAALGYADCAAGDGGRPAANGHAPTGIRQLSRGEDTEEVLERLARGELTEEEVNALLEATSAD